MVEFAITGVRFADLHAKSRRKEIIIVKNLLLKLNLQFFADAFEDVDMDAIVEQTLQEEQPEEIELETDELDSEILEDAEIEEVDEQPEDDSAAPDLSNDE